MCSRYPSTVVGERCITSEAMERELLYQRRLLEAEAARREAERRRAKAVAESRKAERAAQEAAQRMRELERAAAARGSCGVIYPPTVVPGGCSTGRCGGMYPPPLYDIPTPYRHTELYAGENVTRVVPGCGCDGGGNRRGRRRLANDAQELEYDARNAGIPAIRRDVRAINRDARNLY